MRRDLLLRFYERMYESLGPSHWWPGETMFEICLGSILTQNTNWQNVEKAICNLKARGVMTPRTMYHLDHDELAGLIRPAGYFRVKAGRIKNFLSFLYQEADFDLDELKSRDLESLRRQLLAVKGIGPETADSMLLYAFDKSSFVVDAYTARIFCRHGLVAEDVCYEDLRSFFMDALEPDVSLFNEFHALIVRVGKQWCRKKNPSCTECPLQNLF